MHGTFPSLRHYLEHSEYRPSIWEAEKLETLDQLIGTRSSEQFRWAGVAKTRTNPIDIDRFVVRAGGHPFVGTMSTPNCAGRSDGFVMV